MGELQIGHALGVYARVTERGDGMTNDELKEALQSGRRVIYTYPDGHEATYAFVSAIIYRRRNGGIDVSAEIKDLNAASSFIVCDPKRLRFSTGLKE